MDIATLADEYRDISRNKEFWGWDSTFHFNQRSENGLEVAPGWFNLYNQYGQSKIVLLHLESGYIFKPTYGSEHFTASGAYIGEVTLDGDVYQIRIPYFEHHNEVTAQEYIPSNDHTCDGGWCPWAYAIVASVQYHDAHCGNWSLYNGEIVLFDFD